jgi:hypothetical protein
LITAAGYFMALIMADAASGHAMPQSTRLTSSIFLSFEGFDYFAFTT